MKGISFRPADLLLRCLALAVVYVILLQIVAHTHVMEKVMAMTFSWWELLIIAAFLVTRLLTYLIVPPLLMAIGAYTLVRRFAA